MTSTDYDYINACIVVITFLVPAYELIFKKSGKGLKRISNVGWACFTIAIIMGFISFLSINKAAQEKKADKNANDSIRKADKKEIIDAVNLGLSAANLKYDSLTRKVIIDTIIRNSIVYTKESSSINKKILDETTGGDSMVTVSAYIANVDEDSIEVLMSNNTPYTQYDVEMNVFDNFKYQILYKKLANVSLTDYGNYRQIIRNETNFRNFEEKIFKGNWAKIYHTKIPTELDSGFIVVSIKSKNGEYIKTFMFKKFFDSNKITKTLFPFWRLTKEERH